MWVKKGSVGMIVRVAMLLVHIVAAGFTHAAASTESTAVRWLEHQSAAPPPVVSFSVREPAADGTYVPPPNAEFWSAQPDIDEAGIPFFKGPGGERFYNVATVAFAALASTSAYPELDFGRLAIGRTNFSPQQQAALAWLDAHAVVLPNGSATWHYNFPLNYNNLVLRSEWPSAFAQAAVLQAYLLAYDITHDHRWLDLAQRAARAYLVPPEEGGLTSRVQGLPFFEEVPLPGNHSPHVLNGHLYSLVMLREFLQRRDDPELLALTNDAHRLTLVLLPHYDQGYWTRYDLAPRFVDVPLAFYPSPSGAARLRSLRIVGPGGAGTREVLSRPNAQRGADVLYGPGWSGELDAPVIAGGGAFAQVMLPLAPTEGRSAIDPYLVEATFTNGSVAPRLAVLGFRQGIREYYPLRITSSVHGEGGLRVTYELPAADLQWSDLQRYYVECVECR